MREVVFIKQKKLRTDMIFISVAALGCMIYALLFPQPAAASASRALRLCAGAVIPSLALFIIAAKMLAGSGIGQIFAGAERLKRRLGVSGGGLLVLVIGFISGYPAGSAAAAEMCRYGTLSKEEARSLLPYTNNAGPAFLVGAVGAKMLGDAKLGAILLVSQTLSSIILVLLTKRERSANINISFNSANEKTQSASTLLASSVAGGGLALVSVCAFVTFFTVVSDAINAVFENLGVPDVFRAVVGGVFEITSGLDALGRIQNVDTTLTVALAGALVGFSGISVMMQVFDRAGDGGVPTDRYLTGKIFSAILTSSSAVVLTRIFYANSIKSVLFSALFLLVGVIVLILIKKLSKKCGKNCVYDV